MNKPNIKKYGYGKSYDQVEPGFHIYRNSDSIVILEPEDLDHLSEGMIKLIVDTLNRKKGEEDEMA